MKLFEKEKQNEAIKIEKERERKYLADKKKEQEEELESDQLNFTDLVNSKVQSKIAAMFGIKGGRNTPEYEQNYENRTDTYR